MSIHDQLKALRESRKMSKRQLTSELKMNYSTYANYESGAREPNSDFLVRIADFYGVTVDHLMGSEWGKSALALTKPEQNHIKKYRLCDERGREMVDTVLDYEYHRTLRLDAPKPPKLDKVEIPVYLEPAAAGCGAYLENDYCDMVEFPAHDVPHGADFGVRISGNSMEPDIPDGCIAFVKSMPAIEDGEVGIFCLENKGYCKKIHIDHQNQRLSLVSTNKEYDPIYILPEETLYTFGKVLGHTMAEV